MKETDSIPCLPDSAPFTPEQRAYLNGFLAGLFSRAPAAGISGREAKLADAPSLAPLSILFGSQTGNAENLAKRAARLAGQRGFAPTIHDLAKYPTVQLAAESRLLVITSTYGDGEPPDNARNFWQFLSGEMAPKLPETKFSVCALGDSNYPKFCGFGQDVDTRLASLGAQRVHPRADCDLEYEEPFAKWLDAVLTTIGAPASGLAHLVDAPIHSASETSVPIRAEAVVGAPVRGGPETGVPQFSRAHPFPAALLVNRKLNGPGSAKDTRHFEFSLEGSGIQYEAGDALGVRPMNCPALVEEIVHALGSSGAEAVRDCGGHEIPLREALLHHYEITRIPRPLLQSVAGKTGDAELLQLVSPTANGELSKFLWGREIIDLLRAQPSAKFAASEFAGLLRPLQPRLYSIASSPKAHPGRVHLCVSVVRYDFLGRPRKGVCSTFLAERMPANGRAPVFLQRNHVFRPPAGGDTPMIMVGPGTGIAPFRAFLEERQATGAKGKNWLFFGDQKSSEDFLYGEQIGKFRRDGCLTRFDAAWSRDQAEKIYVQHRMRENARELFDWLEAGAHFYVCGDARRMAKDVEAALLEVVQIGGGRSADQAAGYVDRLKSEKRCLRDVY